MKLDLNNHEMLIASTPQEALGKLIEETSQDIPLVVKVISIIGWENIASNIISYRHQIEYYFEGLTLCVFSIDVLGENEKAKISRQSLCLGTECLKSLFEYLCRHNSDLGEEEKSKVIQWSKTFLDIWKEYMSTCLENENRLIA